MVGIDIGCNLEDKAGKLGFRGQDQSLLCLRGAGRRGNLYKAVEQFLHTKIVESRAKEDRSYLSTAIGLDVKSWIDSFYQFQVTTQLLGKLVANLSIELFRLDIDSHLLRHALLVGSEEIKLFFVDIIDALEALTQARRAVARGYEVLAPVRRAGRRDRDPRGPSC